MASKLRSRLPVREGNHTNCESCPIRGNALFEPVAKEHLDWTQQYRSTQYQIPAKTHIYREGEHPQELFTLFEGWVMIYKTLPDGRRQVSRIALPGDFLGFRGRPDQESINHSAQALTPVTLCAFPVDGIRQMFATHPELAERMINIHARDMALCQEYMMGIGRKSAEERLAFLLLEVFLRYRERTNSQATTIPFPITQEEMGDAVGLTMVHINRTLKVLRKSGALECSSRQLSIFDIQKVAEIAQFDLSNRIDRHVA